MPLGVAAYATRTRGAARRQREPDVFHVYDARVTVHPSVDVTYLGRYRVKGGRWFTIPEPLAVVGDDVPLDVVSARVQLVG